MEIIEVMDIKKIEKLILKTLDKEKAENLVTIDLHGKSDIADKLVIATAMSQRHSSALASKLIDKLEDEGIFDIRTEGLQYGDWVLIDAIDIIIHIFVPETRSYYNLERMWQH